MPVPQSDDVTELGFSAGDELSVLDDTVSWCHCVRVDCGGCCDIVLYVSLCRMKGGGWCPTVLAWGLYRSITSRVWLVATALRLLCRQGYRQYI